MVDISGNQAVPQEEALAFTQETKGFIRNAGADKVGVASAALLNSDAPAGHRPEDFLLGATCVIVFTRHFIDTVFNYLPELTATWTSHFMQLQAVVKNIEWRTVEFLETKGFRALMVLSLPGSTSEQKAGLSIKHCAVYAGLGSFGINNLVLTQEHGPRQRIAGVLTNAPLLPDAPASMLSEICVDKVPECGYACVRGCPANALSTQGNKYMKKFECYKYYFKLPCPNVYQEGGQNWRCGLCIANCPLGEKVNWSGYLLDPLGRKRRALKITNLPTEEMTRRMRIYYNRRKIMPELEFTLPGELHAGGKRRRAGSDLPDVQHRATGS